MQHKILAGTSEDLVRRSGERARRGEKKAIFDLEYARESKNVGYSFRGRLANSLCGLREHSWGPLERRWRMGTLGVKRHDLRANSDALVGKRSSGMSFANIAGLVAEG